MALTRARISWQGFPGQPGLTTLLLDGTVTDIAPVRTFFEAIKGKLLNGVSILYPAVGDVIDETTGNLTGAVSFGALSPTTSSNTTQTYAGNVGTHVRWVTSAIVAGHRVRGRMFLVPLPSNQFDTTGQLATLAQAGIQTAAQQMITDFAGKLVVWSRPFAPVPPATTPPARAGSSHAVTVAVVPNRPTILKSRGQ